MSFSRRDNDYVLAYLMSHFPFPYQESLFLLMSTLPHLSNVNPHVHQQQSCLDPLCKDMTFMIFTNPLSVLQIRHHF